jgi:hypothetical protein
MKAWLLATILKAATITFLGTYETQISGRLTSGSNITIDYDLSRAKCSSAFTHGHETRFVSLCYSLNGQVQREIILSAPSNQQHHEQAPIITQVPKGDLAIWFRCSSAANTTYDSNFGKNFNFKVVDIPKIVFKSDFTQSVVDGPLSEGSSVVVDYAQERATCPSAPLRYGQETKNAIMYYSMNGKAPKETPVLLNRESIQPVIENLEKGKLTIWFRCTSMKGTTYDSNNSLNYDFIVQ